MPAALPSKTQSQPSNVSRADLPSATDAPPPHCRESSSQETVAHETAPAYCSATTSSHCQTTPSSLEKVSPDLVPSPVPSATHTHLALPCSATAAKSHCDA